MRDERGEGVMGEKDFLGGIWWYEIVGRGRKEYHRQGWIFKIRDFGARQCRWWSVLNVVFLGGEQERVD